MKRYEVEKRENCYLIFDNQYEDFVYDSYKNDCYLKFKNRDDAFLWIEDMERDNQLRELEELEEEMEL